MALLTNGAQSLGSYYCLIRRRFKRRRKKRSERKGNPQSGSSQTETNAELAYVDQQEEKHYSLDVINHLLSLFCQILN